MELSQDTKLALINEIVHCKTKKGLLEKLYAILKESYHTAANINGHVKDLDLSARAHGVFVKALDKQSKSVMTTRVYELPALVPIEFISKMQNVGEKTMNEIVSLYRRIEKESKEQKS